MRMWVCATEYRCPKRPETDFVEPEPGAVVRHLMQVLGTQLRPFGRAASSLTH